MFDSRDDSSIPPMSLGIIWMLTLLIGIASAILTHVGVLPKAIGSPVTSVAALGNFLLVVAVGALYLGLSVMTAAEAIWRFLVWRLVSLRDWLQEQREPLDRDDDEAKGKWD